MQFQNLAIESMAYELPPVSVSSREIEERLRHVMGNLKVPTRTLELLTGIVERRFWNEGTQVHEAAARVARRAIAAAGIAADAVGVLINTSVSKDYLEPSMASLVHGDVGLSERCMNFDVSNACLGFLNGIEVAGRMIESGAADYALLVDGESSRQVVESTIDRLSAPGATAKDFWDNFATLTLGSAAVAMVLCRADRSRTTHRVNGSVTLADTAQSRLCTGTAERMVTDSTRLLKAGVSLAQKTWQVAAEQLVSWSPAGIRRFVCHQVGESHMRAMCDALRIDFNKCFLSYPTHGNVGPAAVPLTLALAAEAGELKSGDHVALMGIGSGLNVTMMSVTW
ncbi:MAG: 3-oxoacyl-ACP synthase III [Vicinamibacteria bacterium]|nr:3-oxoacyl-ACP synthase III [Vicinamibacteria bacterium]